MKIQSLAILAIIIILPISIILNSYFDSQIKTLNLQVSYDKKLSNATYDAIKAFQLNMFNSDTSIYTDSKMNDISASVNAFYTSLANNFNMSGYGESVLQNYVPAIVYTLYDGYYIYSAYDNKLEKDDADKLKDNVNAKYKDGEKIYGLKPYIYYSCRYRPTELRDSDFVITYSLDSHITIQGEVNGTYVNKSGYLLTGVSNDPLGNIKYDGVDIIEEIGSEGLQQYIYKPGDTTNEIDFGDDWTSPGSIISCSYKKNNGTKIYRDSADFVFTATNDKVLPNGTDKDEITNNSDGKKYYREASEFGEWIKSQNLDKLKTSDAVDQNGIYYKNYSTEFPGVKDPPFQIERKIFAEINNEDSGKWIEDPNSEFNAHKIEVIKNSIESNLIAAISNYNNFSTSEVNFAMPRLQDYEWEELTQNVSMITFLQGLNIGGKVYNGHAIVRNDLTGDYVSEDSIYIANHDKNTYYRVTDKSLVENSAWSEKITGLLDLDFERRTSSATAKKADGTDEKLTRKIYYYPRTEMGSYGSIISFNNVENKPIIEYLREGRNGDYGNEGRFKNLSQAYYTALGRERYEMYRLYEFK